MIRLKHSDILGRKIRKDDWNDIGASTWSLVEEAILEDDEKQALELLDYLYEEGKAFHDFTSDMWAGCVTYVGSNFGEEEVESIWRYIVSDTVLGSEATRGDTLERIYVGAELWRGHYMKDGEFNLVEEEDRYVLTLDPCPTGGRMLITGRLEAPYNLAKTSKPYPWSWNRAGIPWYCTHCTICRCIMAIESSGYPVRVHEYPEDLSGRCRLIYYKHPESIPDKYFAEIGMSKHTSKAGA